MELEFHAGFFKKLDFQQIEFFIETQFSKNEFQNMDISLNSFRHEAFSQKVWLKGVKPNFGQDSPLYFFLAMRMHVAFFLKLLVNSVL